MFFSSFVSSRSHRPRRIGVAVERKRKPRGDARSAVAHVVAHVVGLGVARSSCEQRQGKAWHTRPVPVQMLHGVAAGQAQLSGPVPMWHGGHTLGVDGAGVPQSRSRCNPGSTSSARVPRAVLRRARTRERTCALRRSAASSRRGSRSTPAPGTAQAQCRPVRAILVVGLAKIAAQRGY